MKTICVVAGIVMYQGKILCVQRPRGKFDYISFKWEFPGGKIEEHETKENALKRELKEELGLEIHGVKEFIQVSHQYPDFKIIMDAFLCNVEMDRVIRMEHMDHQWLTPKEMIELNWADADRPILKKILEVYNGI